MKSTTLQDQIQIAAIVYNGFATACDLYARENGIGYSMTDAYSELCDYRIRWFDAWCALRECDEDHIVLA